MLRTGSNRNTHISTDVARKPLIPCSTPASVALYESLVKSFLEDIPTVSFDIIRRIASKENGPAYIAEMRQLSISRIRAKNRSGNQQIFDLLDRDIPTCISLDIEDELAPFLEHSVLLCTFIDIHFKDKDMLTRYYEKCMARTTDPVENTRCFYQEILYLMIMRLDATFEEYILSFATIESTSPDSLPRRLELQHQAISQSAREAPLTQLNNLYTQIIQNFQTELPQFLKYTVDDIFHHIAIVISAIPYMINNRSTIIHRYIPLYDRIKYILPHLNPHTSVMGMYIYVRFMTATHIKLIYDDVMSPITS